MEEKKNKSKETAGPLNETSEHPDDIHSDVLGSYTGLTEDGEEPIQDADDL